MASGMLGRIRALETELDPDQRLVDAAINLAVCDKTKDGYRRTGETIRFGGVWDIWTRCYTGDEPSNVITREVTAEQLAYCTSRKARITGAGGRGGGKSEALAQRAECLLLSRPGEHGLIVSPDYSHTRIVWDKLLKRIHGWTLPGTQGIHRTDRLLRLINGSTVRFLSADNPDSLRGWDAHWCGVDEEKDVADEAIDIVMLCLRLSAKPLVFGAGTPEVGEYSERYDRLVKDEDNCAVFKFPSRDNVFIPHTVFDLALSQMDERRYRQEVLAEFVEMDLDEYVVRGSFNPDEHKREEAELGTDITHLFTNRKVGQGFSYIAGVDYQFSAHNAAWIYKVYDGKPRRWVVVGIVHASGSADDLAQAMIETGFTGRNTLVVDDASGEYNKYGKNKGPNSSARLMRMRGFRCIHKKRNPQIKDRVNAFLAKLKPARGAPSWFYASHVAEVVEKTMKTVKWQGSVISKKEGVDHDFDAGTYPIAYFEPAAVLQIPRIAGLAA